MKELLQEFEGYQAEADIADMRAFSTFEHLYNILIKKIQEKYKLVKARWMYDEYFEDVAPMSTFPKTIYLIFKGGNERYIDQQDEETMVTIEIKNAYLTIVIGGENLKDNQEVSNYIKQLLGLKDE